MASPTEKLVNLDLSYLTLNDKGEPEEIEEEWYAYFTMGTFSKMYKKLGVPEDRAKELAEEAQKGAESTEDGAEDFQDRIIEEVETTEFEANILLVWASLQWHARQRGVEITPEDVGDRITADNAEYIITQVMRALEGFQTGTVPTMEEIERRREEASEEEGAEGKDPSSGDDKSSPQS